MMKSNQKNKHIISASLKGHAVSNATRANLVKARANKKPPTDETKKRISEKLKGRKLSIETRAKISVAKKGQRLGTTLSTEQKAKISASLKSYWAS